MRWPRMFNMRHIQMHAAVDKWHAYKSCLQQACHVLSKPALL